MASAADVRPSRRLATSSMRFARLRFAVPRSVVFVQYSRRLPRSSYHEMYHGPFVPRPLFRLNTDPSPLPRPRTLRGAGRSPVTAGVSPEPVVPVLLDI